MKYIDKTWVITLNWMVSEDSPKSGRRWRPFSLVFCVKVTDMAKPRGREHTSLTETAALVVRELKKIPGIKMIAPGEIRTARRSRAGSRFVTANFTTSGMELLISGQSVQRVAVHTSQSETVYEELKKAKSLRDFAFKSRERKPGI